jgi:hypothetical protein
MKWLAGAITFSVLVFAVMFRFEYERAGTIRINRWTGERQELCGLNSGAWAWVDDCFTAQHRE